ncbi:Spc24-domain-containing protein [Wolfiporia cocos MD-104 SS10]|uniref:Kinetochore protein Spc24 n=1 Tax=Wolfiporia cocos (strain MD-104) TaxID=742152 RepID=A0A2H3J7Y4_WOLCO|nr:Spc24-domain-containing protein [Wolfiporia cocos MD-104 SS10]
MSISIKDTVKALRDMRPLINPDGDFMTITAAEERMAITEAERRKELEGLQSKLRTMTRNLEAARVSSTRPSTIPSAEAHAAMINELDGQRLQLVKAINDAESALASKEAELARLKEELRALEEYDSAAEHDLDSTALRLAIYKGLGFEPIMGDDGRIAKMLVRSSSGDVHCVVFDSSTSDYEYTDLLWKLASS